MKNNDWLSTVVSCHNSWLSDQSRKVMARVATWSFSYCYRCIRHDIGIMSNNQLKAKNPQAALVPAPRKPCGSHTTKQPKSSEAPNVGIDPRWWLPQNTTEGLGSNHPNLKELPGENCRCFEAWNKSSRLTDIDNFKGNFLENLIGDRKRIFMSTGRGNQSISQRKVRTIIGSKMLLVADMLVSSQQGISWRFEANNPSAVASGQGKVASSSMFPPGPSKGHPFAGICDIVMYNLCHKHYI